MFKLNWLSAVHIRHTIALIEMQTTHVFTEPSNIHRREFEPGVSSLISRSWCSLIVHRAFELNEAR